MQGLFHYRQAVTREHVGAALSCWTKALELDPTSASLNAMIGFIHYVNARFGWWGDPQTAQSAAQRYADRALELDPDNPDANITASLSLLQHGRFDESVARARRATQLAPGSADVASLACFMLAFAGYPDEAVAHGERAMTLSPNYPAKPRGCRKIESSEDSLPDPIGGTLVRTWQIVNRHGNGTLDRRAKGTPW